MPSDRDLVNQILEHNTEAFETLLGRYESPIRRHVARIVRDDAATQDLVQETFLRVWMRAAQWDGRGTFKAWLYRIATNLALNHLRTVRRRRETSLEIEDAGNEDEGNLVPAWMVDVSSLGPDAALEQSEQHEQVQHLMRRLPEEKRTVFRLVHELEMTVRDAAEQLGIPEGTAKSRLYYARKQLAHDWQALETPWEEL